MYLLSLVLALVNLTVVVSAGNRCTSGVHIFACSGHGRLPHGYGHLETTMDEIRSAIPDSTNFSVPYPKKEDDQPAAIMVGVNLLTQEIGNYTTDCPDTPIVLVGYSEGAIVASNTLCGRSHKGAPFSDPLPSYYAQFIIASVFYGDETFVSGQSYNRGTCTNGHGTNPRQNEAGCAAFENNMRSYCDGPDPFCCGGTVNATHYVYAEKYNYNATQFIVKQYNAYNTAKARRRFVA